VYAQEKDISRPYFACYNKTEHMFGFIVAPIFGFVKSFWGMILKKEARNDGRRPYESKKNDQAYCEGHIITLTRNISMHSSSFRPRSSRKSEQNGFFAAVCSLFRLFPASKKERAADATRSFIR